MSENKLPENAEARFDRPMAQGSTKRHAKPSSSKARHTAKAAAVTKKGRRHEPPKKPVLIKQAGMRKVVYRQPSTTLFLTAVRHSKQKSLDR